MPLPFAGIRVLDLSTVLSGPIAVSMLCDQGAEVIKVESAEGDTSRMIGPAKGDLSAMFIAVNRGKRAIALDLKSPASKPVLEALLRRADVVVSNFRPGVMARLGLDDAHLVALNPQLIRMSISGYGPDGPYQSDKVYDAVIQAAAGVSAFHREYGTGAPSLLASTLCDKLTALNAAQAISAALFARSRDGQGRRVEVSMLDATLAFQWPDAMYNHMFLDDAPPLLPAFGATSRPWKTSDGHVATMAPLQSEFVALCKAVGREDIAADERFKDIPSRRRHAAALRETLEQAFSVLSCEQVLAQGRRFGLPIAKVNDLDEVITDPQVQHNDSLVAYPHGVQGRVRLARTAARFDGQATPIPGPAPHRGEHGRQILTELGYDEAGIADLIAQGALRLPA